MSHASIHTNIFFFDKPNLAKKNCLSERTLMHPKDADSIANIEDPDQTASLGTDLGLQYLPRPICPKTWSLRGYLGCQEKYFYTHLVMNWCCYLPSTFL